MAQNLKKCAKKKKFCANLREELAKKKKKCANLRKKCAKKLADWQKK
ncbi:MAG: hypothetical protein LUM44_15265 [Pyrinomonadaceae bacterium]|nr:hypothetical protein [Pyrinomonadaceae bacterium]